jgi:hypothetical protein
MQKNFSKYKLLIFFSLLLIYFLLINFLTPLASDDFYYSMSVYRNTSLPESLADIFIALLEQYIKWTGRIVANFIGMVFLLIGKPLFNIANALMFCLLIYLMFFHAFARKPKNQDITILVSLLLLTWFMQPNIGETVFWLTGAANYLWTTVIILLFLLPYRLLLENRIILKENFDNISKFCILGILAGWTNENTAFISILAIGLILIIKYSENKLRQLPKWFYSGLAGQIIGYMFLILAPGNIRRAEYLINNNYDTSFYYKFYPLYKIVFADRFFLWALIIFFILESCRKLRFKGSILSLSYILLGFLNIFIMLLAPIFPLRATFAGIIFIITGVTALFFNSLESKREWRFSVTFWTMFLLISLYSFTSVFNNYLILHYEVKGRISQVLKDKANKMRNINVETLTQFTDLHVFAPDITSNRWAVLNQQFALYYGFNSVGLNKK